MQLDNAFLIRIIQLLLHLLRMQLQLLLNPNMPSHIILQLLQLLLILLRHLFLLLLCPCRLHLIRHLFQLLTESTIPHRDEVWLFGRGEAFSFFLTVLV